MPENTKADIKHEKTFKNTKHTIHTYFVNFRASIDFINWIYAMWVFSMVFDCYFEVPMVADT